MGLHQKCLQTLVSLHFKKLKPASSITKDKNNPLSAAKKMMKRNLDKAIISTKQNQNNKN
jgi:hypothetical protein